MYKIGDLVRLKQSYWEQFSNVNPSDFEAVVVEIVDNISHTLRFLTPLYHIGVGNFYDTLHLRGHEFELVTKEKRKSGFQNFIQKVEAYAIKGC